MNARVLVANRLLEATCLGAGASPKAISVVRRKLPQRPRREISVTRIRSVGNLEGNTEARFLEERAAEGPARRLRHHGGQQGLEPLQDLPCRLPRSRRQNPLGKSAQSLAMILSLNSET